MRSAFHAAGILLTLAALAACDVGFYWQAAGGQMEILGRRRPIPDVLADDRIDEPTKAKLRLVLAVQAFGVERLRLPAEGQYTLYTDLQRPQVSWLVVASERYAIRAVEHCYPIVGCMGYRGYFDREDADGFAGSLDEEGYDVLVRPVRAYSTLGWFDDPVLNTMLVADDLELMGTILHEQAHRVVFAVDDTAFNESFAVFVEREGVRRYLLADGGGDGGDANGNGESALGRYRDRQADRRRYRAILERGRGRLEALYESALPEPDLRSEKARLFEGMRQDYEIEKNSFIIIRYDRWFAQELNNAHLVSIRQYESRVAAFERLFQQNGEDFGKFYEAARELAELDPDQRRARLEELER